MADGLRSVHSFYAFIITFCSVALLLTAAPSQANDDIEKAGDIMLAIVPAAAYGLTFKSDDNDGRKQFYKSILSTAAITYGLKKTVSRKRPNNKDRESFPSGHTSLTFSSAAFMQKRYGWKYGLPAYAAASFVGWSRLDSDNHHVEDVIAGALIGTVSAYCFTTHQKGNVHATPFVEEKTYGLMINGEW